MSCAAMPLGNRVSVDEFHATLLHLLGLDFRELVYERNGLNDRITDQIPARIVSEILARENHEMSVRSAQRSATSRIAVALACFGCVAALAQDRTPSSAAVSLTFEKQILPIFEARCAKCHSGASPQAGLDIRTTTGLLNGGTTGPAIVSGSAEKSLLYQRVRTGQMPLGGPPLSGAELELIRNWIERSAPASPSPAFAGKIRSIFAERCFQCHGPDVQQNGLRLDSLAAALKGSASGRVVIPGDSEK